MLLFQAEFLCIEIGLFQCAIHLNEFKVFVSTFLGVFYFSNFGSMIIHLQSGAQENL